MPRNDIVLGLKICAKYVFFVPCILLLPACASVKVTNFSENRSLRPELPPSSIPLSTEGFYSLSAHEMSSSGSIDGKTLILDTSNCHVRVSGSPEKTLTPSKLGILVARDLGRAWSGNWKQPAAKVTGKTIPPRLLVKGQLWDEHPGSRILRVMIGLGVGRTRLSGKFYAYNLSKSSKQPWLTIFTEGGSGREPGAVWSLMPGPTVLLNVAALASAVVVSGSHLQKGLNQDAARTARTLSAFMKSRLAEDPSSRRRVKPPMAGSIEVPLLGSVRVPLSKSALGKGGTLYVGDTSAMKMEGRRTSP